MKFTGLLGAVGEVFFLVQEVHRHKTIIERRSEVNRLARAVEKLTSEAENSKEVHRLERENLRLQLQNALSHFERRLPPQ